MTTLKRFNGTDWEYIGFPTDVGMSPQTLGYAQVVADEGGKPAAGSNITGLSLTITVPEGRRIKLTAHGLLRNDTAGAQRIIRFLEGATYFGYGAQIQDVANNSEITHLESVITPTAGTHTYHVWVGASGGTTTVRADPTFPFFFLIEDITGSTLPYQPASVPVGRLAYIEASADITGITTGSGVVASANISVPEGRTIRIRGEAVLQSTAVDDQIYLSIKEGGTTLRYAEHRPRLANVGENFSTEYVFSPTAGAHTYSLEFSRGFSATGTLSSAGTGTRKGYMLIEDITPTPAPSSGAPGSTLGYAESTVSQTSVTTEVDRTGLSVNVTVPAGRRLRITAHSPAMSSTVAGDSARMWIKEGATGLTLAQSFIHATGSGGPSLTASTVVSPSAGSHTYKVTVLRNTGTGSLTFSADPTFPAFILVEDITGSVWPEGSPITAGMVASEPFGTWTPVITQSNTPAQTINRAVFTKVGRLWTGFFHISFTSAGTATNNIFLSGFPVAASNLSFGGSFRYFDAGNTIRAGTIIGNTTTQVAFVYDGYGNSMGFGDFIIANGDMISGMLTFETAS